MARSGERERTLAGVRVSGAWFSPDGQKVVLSAVSDAPLGVRPGPLKFLLFDLQRDGLFPRAEILAGAGEGSRAPAAIWSADGSTAILVNAKLPGANEGVLAQMLAATGELKVLEPMAGQTAAGMQSVSDVLLMGKDELHVMHESGGKPVARTVYSLRNGEWTGQPGALSVGRRDPRQLSGLEALVRQSVNDPSIAYVVRGKQELALIEPDPALQGVSRAGMQKFEWQEPNGARMSGGLYLPRDVKLGKPVPLVIQDHTFNQKTFLPDGPYTHSDAAQTLVAQGMAVLQMGTDYNLPVEKLGSEGAELVARIDIVVEKLAAQGIIDPQRVGVTEIRAADIAPTTRLRIPDALGSLLSCVRTRSPATTSGICTRKHSVVGPNSTFSPGDPSGKGKQRGSSARDLSMSIGSIRPRFLRPGSPAPRIR